MTKRTWRRRTRVLTLGVAIAVAAAAGAVAIATSASAASTWQQVSVGYRSTCAIKTDQSLWCWGSNRLGQLGIGSFNGRVTSPQQVARVDLEDYEEWVHVSVGAESACALTTLHRRYCWGENTYGQLGLSASNNYIHTPTRTRAAEEPSWQSLSVGWSHTCGIDTSGFLYCWGSRVDGATGIRYEDRFATQEHWSIPTKVNDMGWHSVSAGYMNTCGRTYGDEAIYCWGNNEWGQLGIGTIADEDDPDVHRPGRLPPSSRKWERVTVGGGHVCAIEKLGRLWCWGANPSGHLGQGTTTRAESTPRPLSGSGGDYEDWWRISAGHNHTCAIRATGQLRCWGNGEEGQLGVGDKKDRLYATPLSGTWTSAAADITHTCAIRSNGGLYCWGDNSEGQLGLGHLTERLTPTRIP